MTEEKMTKEIEKAETKTKMVAEKKTRIKLIRDAMVNGEIQLADTEHFVSEADANELCETRQGLYTHSGYRYADQAPRNDNRRAVRV